MATLVQYLANATQTSSGDSVVWMNQSNSYGQNLTLNNSSYINSSKKIYVTNLFNGFFDYNEYHSFFQNNSDTEIFKIEYFIKYKISTTPNNVDSYSYLNIYLVNSSGSISITPEITNNTYSTSSESGVKTASFTFSVNGSGCPSTSQVNDSEYGLVLSVSSSNPNEIPILIEIYEIKQVITLSSNINPNIFFSIIENNIESRINSNQTFDFGSFSIGSSFDKTYTIKNTGSSDLIISNFLLSSNISFQDTYQTPITISPEESVNITVVFNVNLPSQYQEFLKISSNSNNDSLFVLNFKYAGSLASSDKPIIDLYYNSRKVLNDKIISLSSTPVSISKFIPVKIFNYGVNPLSIASISVSGDGIIGVGTDISSGSTIQSNSYKTLNILINTSSLGNKQINISINSNDYQNNPFRFYFTYSVLEQFLASITSGKDSILDGSTFVLGSLDRGKSFTKSYILKNSGIYKTMIINSISTNKDITLKGSYNFPFTLMPNEANSLVFTISFDTNNSGLRNGSFTLNYDEGNVL